MRAPGAITDLGNAHRKTRRFQRVLRMGGAGLEPATSCV
jgi:hypothetical protein